jgi:hypothetical protein
MGLVLRQQLAEALVALVVVVWTEKAAEQLLVVLEHQAKEILVE